MRCGGLQSEVAVAVRWKVRLVSPRAKAMRSSSAAVEMSFVATTDLAYGVRNMKINKTVDRITANYNITNGSLIDSHPPGFPGVDWECLLGDNIKYEGEL